MNRIYASIQFKPKIWGLYFTSLFSILGGFLVLMMTLSFLLNMFAAITLSILISGLIYFYFYYRDNRDEIEYSARMSGALKMRITSYMMSQQSFRIKDQ
ncbi:MAG: hypothetical protein ABFR75_05560 [Acidobacteriota bacterium]